MIRLCLNPPGRAIEDTAKSREKLRTQNEKTLANDVMWGARKLKTTPTFWLRQLDSVINQNRKKRKHRKQNWAEENRGSHARVYGLSCCFLT